MVNEEGGVSGVGDDDLDRIERLYTDLHINQDEFTREAGYALPKLVGEVRALRLPTGSVALFARRMILCPSCGNKRCPKATNHRQGCTGSNDPGQPGSAYVTTADQETP